jgi:hypothetical protein
MEIHTYTKMAITTLVLIAKMRRRRKRRRRKRKFKCSPTAKRTSKW